MYAEYRQFLILQSLTSPDGGIGRHAVFRWQCRKVCRFDSCSGYQASLFKRGFFRNTGSFEEAAL